MKQTLIALAIILASCTEETPYFINSELSQYADQIRVESNASEGVKEIIISYEYFLSPGELNQSKKFKASTENQNANFTVDRQDQLVYLNATVIDSNGNYKVFEL